MRKKLKKIIKKIKKKIINIFSHHCPECGGRMENKLWDIKYDRPIYKCTKCGKEWI